MKKGNHTVKLETGVSLFNPKTISNVSTLHMPELQKLIFQHQRTRPRKSVLVNQFALMLLLKTPASLSPCGGQSTLSTQLITPNQFFALPYSKTLVLCCLLNYTEQYWIEFNFSLLNFPKQPLQKKVERIPTPICGFLQDYMDKHLSVKWLKVLTNHQTTIYMSFKRAYSNYIKFKRQ